MALPERLQQASQFVGAEGSRWLLLGAELPRFRPCLRANRETRAAGPGLGQFQAAGWLLSSAGKGGAAERQVRSRYWPRRREGRYLGSSVCCATRRGIYEYSGQPKGSVGAGDLDREVSSPPNGQMRSQQGPVQAVAAAVVAVAVGKQARPVYHPGGGRPAGGASKGGCWRQSQTAQPARSCTHPFTETRQPHKGLHSRHRMMQLVVSQPTSMYCIIALRAEAMAGLLSYSTALPRVPVGVGSE